MTRHPHTYRLATVLATAAITTAAITVAGCSATGDSSATSATTSATTSASTSATSSPSTSPSSSATASASPSPSTSALPVGAKTLEVTITGKQVTPAPASIALRAGQTLRLVVTDDADNVLHAHGFDKEVDLVAGQPTTVDLVTTSPGKYEVETHHPELKLLTVLVR